jgi:hypothetical protein
MARPKTWDEKSKALYYKGVTTQFYTRTALAMALKREPSTIRHMELNGVLCHPLVRNHQGHWLYTREQIESLVELAREEGVLDPRYRNPFSERFIREAARILKREP